MSPVVEGSPASALERCEATSTARRESSTRAEGADVASAANGREATDLVAAQRFDVVLSDLGLPDIPGDVLIRELRARSGRATRVVVVTGYGEPFLARARQAGADVVFTKPVEWSRILEYLEHPDFAASA